MGKQTCRSAVPRRGAQPPSQSRGGAAAGPARRGGRGDRPSQDGRGGSPGFDGWVSLRQRLRLLSPVPVRKALQFRGVLRSAYSRDLRADKLVYASMGALWAEGGMMSHPPPRDRE